VVLVFLQAATCLDGMTRSFVAMPQSRQQSPESFQSQFDIPQFNQRPLGFEFDQQQFQQFAQPQHQFQHFFQPQQHLLHFFQPQQQFDFHFFPEQNEQFDIHFFPGNNDPFDIHFFPGNNDPFDIHFFPGNNEQFDIHFFPEDNFQLFQNPILPIIAQELPKQQAPVAPKPPAPVNIAIEQENDPVETKEYINKANVNIEKVFKRAFDEMDRSEKQLDAHFAASVDAFRVLKENGMTHVRGTKDGSNQCLKTLEKETLDTIEANAVANQQCVDQAKRKNAALRNEARKALERDHELAVNQNMINTEHLFMCASSQFALCVEERTHLRASILSADVAAKSNVAQVKKAIDSEAEMLATCLEEATEDHEDMIFDITNARELCETRK